MSAVDFPCWPYTVLNVHFLYKKAQIPFLYVCMYVCMRRSGAHVFLPCYMALSSRQQPGRADLRPPPAPSSTSPQRTAASGRAGSRTRSSAAAADSWDGRRTEEAGADTDVKSRERIRPRRAARGEERDRKGREMIKQPVSSHLKKKPLVFYF